MTSSSRRSRRRISYPRHVRSSVGVGAGSVFLVILVAATACERPAEDESDAVPASAAAVDSAAVPASSETDSALRRWTDRELVLDTSRIRRDGRDSASIARKIADAMRAGPSTISAGAVVIDRAAEEGGMMLPIRAGNGAWVCLPDDPITPVDDPACLNGMAQRWASAIYQGRETYAHRGLGVIYKLQGGAIASNTDPFLIRPASGDSWVIEPPHVILIFQDTTGLGALPEAPGQGGPWVSWRGTPYMNVKVPIAP